MDFLIIYEFKAREAETAVLLKYELERRGYTAEVVNFFHLNRIEYHFRKKPKVVIMPFLYNSEFITRHVYGFSGRVNKVFNLQWEQLYRQESEVISKQVPSENAKDAVHLCWGRQEYERLLVAGNSKSVLLGHPGMDFLKERFDKWFLDKNALCKKYGINPHKQILFFISSFNYISVDDYQLEFVKTVDDFDPYEFKDLTIRTRTEVLRWFARYLKENEDAVIVYRPHPGELSDELTDKMEEEFDDFYVIRDYSIGQWIKVADVILNWYSTAAVECYFAGKGNLMLRPYEISDEMDYSMFKDVTKIDSYENFERAVNSKEMMEHNRNAVKDSIEANYLDDGSYAYENICDLLVEMRNTSKYDMDKRYASDCEITFNLLKDTVKALMVNTSRLLPQKIQDGIRRKGLLYRVFRDYDQYRAERITKKEMNRMYNRFDKIFREL